MRKPWHGRWRCNALAPVFLCAGLLASVACFGDDDGVDVRQVSPEPRTTTATQPAGSSPAATETPEPSPTPEPTETPTQEPEPTPTETGPNLSGEAAAATEAAAAALNATPLETLSRDACVAAEPPGGICIALQSAPSTAEGGLARFNGGDLDGGGFLFFMGRTPGGAWDFWFGTQQQYDVPEQLPGAALACGEGSPVTIYAGPGGAGAIDMVDHLSALTVDEFALTSPGSFQAGGARGEGWYRVSAPIEGWVSEHDLTDAAFGDCLFHEARAGQRG